MKKYEYVSKKKKQSRKEKLDQKRKIMIVKKIFHQLELTGK